MKTLLKPAIATLAATFALTLALQADDTNSTTTTPATGTLPPAATKTGVTYDTDIKPIFEAACVKCHDSTKKPRGGLALDTLAGTLKGSRDGAVVTPGDSAHSDLVLSVAHVGDPDTFMPKGKNAKVLTADQIGLIRAWIDQGAK